MDLDVAAATATATANARQGLLDARGVLRRLVDQQEEKAARFRKADSARDGYGQGHERDRRRSEPYPASSPAAAATDAQRLSSCEQCRRAKTRCKRSATANNNNDSPNIASANTGQQKPRCDRCESQQLPCVEVLARRIGRRRVGTEWVRRLC